MRAGGQVADPVDLVREACTQLARYMGTLELEVTEQPSPSGGPVGMSPRPPASPEPWNAPAGHALMDAHEFVRRLEARLLYELTGHPGRRRGGSQQNTAQALDAIPRLAAGLSQADEAAAARLVERRVNTARAVRAIDEAQQWRAVPSRPCPHCACYFLKVLLDAAGRPTGHVECFTVGCRDGNGLRPVAAMGTDGRGWPELQWADGLVEAAPDLDG
jgi:hypothetical protein